MPVHKPDIHQHCIKITEDKIAGLQQLLADARDASNNDTKSSMGDKYETTREMMQIEMNKLNLQLSETRQMLLALKVIDAEKSCEKAVPGALIQTDNMLFYLATGLGKITVDKTQIMVISPASPLGKIISGRQKGDQFALNGKPYSILSIS